MIDLQNISKSYGRQDVFCNASVRVNPKERIGIVGANGSGKSTIFGLITGEVTPDKGTVSLPGNLRIGHLRQHFDPESLQVPLLLYSENAVPQLKDVQERLDAVERRLAAAASEKDLKLLGELQSRFEDGGGYRLRHQTEAALSGLGFKVSDFDKRLGEFSGGWQMRAELVRVLNGDPDVLLLDEPSNYLDLPAIEWVSGYLDSYTGTLLLISHDRYLLNTLTRETFEVAGTQVTRYRGNYDEYLSTREQRYEQLLAAHQNQERKKEQIERFVERFRAKNTKASQVQSRVKMLDKMETVKIPVLSDKAPALRLATPSRTGQEVIRLSDAGFRYGAGPWLFRHIDVRVERGQKVAVVGFNGMGKTTLLRVLAGRLDLVEGKREPGYQVVPGYMSQEITETMDTSMTVWEVARRAAAGNVTEVETRVALGSFRFSGEAIEKKVSVLSGGERMRLSLIRLLLNPPNFLILDEPTTHLDIGSRELLQNALRDFKGTLCLVSHDIEFVRHVADHIFLIENGQFMQYYGGYDYYREKRQQELQTATISQKATTVAEPTSTLERKQAKRAEAAKRQEQSRLRKPLQERLKQVESNIDRLETEQKQLLARLTETNISRLDYEQINRRLAQIQNDVAEATVDWEKTALDLEEVDGAMHE